MNGMGLLLCLATSTQLTQLLDLSHQLPASCRADQNVAACSSAAVRSGKAANPAVWGPKGVHGTVPKKAQHACKGASILLKPQAFKTQVTCLNVSNSCESCSIVWPGHGTCKEPETQDGS